MGSQPHGGCWTVGLGGEPGQHLRMIKANLLMQTPPPTSEIVSDLEVSEAEKRELDSRWARFERDPSRAMTLEQFRELDIARRG
jgi:hypothetical protein